MVILAGNQESRNVDKLEWSPKMAPLCIPCIPFGAPTLPYSPWFVHALQYMLARLLSHSPPPFPASFVAVKGDV